MADRALDEPLWLRVLLIVLAVGLMAALVLLPLAVVMVEALAQGVQAWWTAVDEPDTRAAIWLTLTVAAIAVPLNAVFGLAFARGLGEYGSVIFIAGNIPFVSEIAPLLIVIRLEEFDYAGATGIATLMLAISFLTLLALGLLQRKTRHG